MPFFGNISISYYRERKSLLKKNRLPNSKLYITVDILNLYITVQTVLDRHIQTVIIH